MTEQNNEVIPMPACNGCGERPLPIRMNTVNTPFGIVLGIIHCAKCGYTYHFMPIGTVPEPDIVLPTPKDRMRIV